MKKIIFFVVLAYLICDSEKLEAQLVVENEMTVEQLVDNILVGMDIITSNIKFNGLAADQIQVQAAYFNSEDSNIPILSGLLLTTGDFNVAVGPNNSPSAGSNVGGSYQDDDLNAIATASTNNAAVLEFDFIPTTDSFIINYVFASEEYNEYVCASFNDVFGIFISGPGFSGPYQNGAENISIVPDTDLPVAINNINNGNIGGAGSSANCTEEQLSNTEYFNDNENNQNVNSTQYDGFTVKLQAVANVISGQTYHIKIAIADAADAILDSGVFIEEGSLGSISEQLVINEFMTSNDSWNIPGETEPELQPDWIEIYNAGDTTIDMGGWYVSDDFSDLMQWQLPTDKPELTIIPAHGYLLLLCDGLDNSNGALHTNFKLGSDGEDIVISKDGVTVIDGGSYCDTGCYFPLPGTDNSSGRSTDGANDWLVFLMYSDVKPTPGSANGVVVLIQLVINEFMASNDFAYSGPQGDYPDWIEIFNEGQDDVMLGGYFMSDDLSDPAKMYRILDTYPDSVKVPAGGHIVFYANKDTLISVLNLNFKLSSGGEQIGIWAPDTSVIDTLTYVEQYTDTSYGRVADGAAEWVLFSTSTPWLPNDEGVIVSVISYSKVDFTPLLVYPNPVIGSEVKFNKIVNIQVYNLAGQRLFVDNNVSSLNVDQFDSGLYLIQTDEGERVKLIIK